jgi:uncharacterized protein YndB with AHSA1/START domain
MSAPAVIELDQFYSASPRAVWRALTDPEWVARWWAPGDVRPVVGHLFDLDMGQWGMQKCQVLAVETERLIQYRFAMGRLDTIITWRLTPEGSGTRLALRHEGFQLDTPMGKMSFEGMKPGWPKVLGRLESALTGAE